jgi:hypothetical protein
MKSQQEILSLLIPYYKEHLKVVRKMDSLLTAYEYLISNDLHHGICACATNVFGVGIYGADWIEKLTKARGSVYIANTPYHCNTLPEIIQSLETRISIMESMLVPQSV